MNNHGIWLCVTVKSAKVSDAGKNDFNQTTTFTLFQEFADENFKFDENSLSKG